MTYHADQELFKNTLKNNYISIYIGITRYYPFITIHSKNGLPASNLFRDSTGYNFNFTGINPIFCAKTGNCAQDIK